MLQKQFVCARQGKLHCCHQIQLSDHNPICGGGQACHQGRGNAIYPALPNITRCIPRSVFVINFPYIQGIPTRADTQVGFGALESLIKCHQADIYFPITNSIGWETCYLDCIGLGDWIITIAHNTQFVVVLFLFALRALTSSDQSCHIEPCYYDTPCTL